MNENQRKWLLDLQSKGVKFENCSDCYSGRWIRKGEWGFIFDSSNYRIPAQPIPNIPDWREVCMEMYDKGMKFEMYNNYTGQWINSVGLFDSIIKRYRIPQQPLPEWREEMTEETKPDPMEEIPHRELQIQWHEGMLRHLRADEPMPVWEYRLKNGDGEWRICHDPHFSEKYEYRRKPKEIAYYHCVISRLDKTTGLTITGVVTRFSKDDLESYVRCEKFKGQSTKLGPIVETIVEMED